MPELIYDAPEAVPAALKDIAKEKDGKWVANVVPKAELDDFRNRNVEISRERDGLTSLVGRLTTDLAFDPADPDAFVSEIGELRTIKQQVEDGKLVKDTSLAQALESKTAEMKRTYDGQLNGLQNENKSLKGENEKLKIDLNTTKIDNAVTSAINNPKSGALAEATPQILREAREVFTIDENGQLIAKDPTGNVIYGGDGATPMTPMEWLTKQQEVTPFFFKSAQGGGGGGGGPIGGTLTQTQLDNMSPAEKMNYGREHGLNKS